MHSHWANVNLVLLSSMCVWVPDKPKSGYDTRRKESEPRRSLVMYGSGDVRDRRGGVGDGRDKESRIWLSCVIDARAVRWK